MSDETTKTDNETTSTQTNDGEVKKVEMTQEELNNLINKKYASGAEKAKNELLNSLGVESEDTLKDLIEAKKQQEEANKTELEKLQEQLNQLSQERDNLSKTLTESQEKAKLQRMALENGIEDVDYLEFKLSKARKEENFDENKFLEEFKSKNKTVVKTDSSSNNNHEDNLDFSNITDIRQLQKLSKTLT